MDHSINTPGARFDIRVVASGEIEIYTPDGELRVGGSSNNVVRLYCVPSWNDETAIKIVEHEIAFAARRGESPGDAAERIVNALRSRTNVNKEKIENG